MSAMGWSWQAVGRRKAATARVYMKPGDGKIIINGRPLDVYLKRKVLEMIVHQPLELTETVGKYDILCSCSGGGLSGQADAIKHGISRALLAVDTDKYRGMLKSDADLIIWILIKALFRIISHSAEEINPIPPISAAS